MQENEKILIEKIEELNREYLNTGYYELGKYSKYLMYMLKKRKFIKIFQHFIYHLKNKKLRDKNIPHQEENKITEKYVINGKNKNKIAVYTCITGNYDNIEEPLILESGCDYYLFTNNDKIKSDIWNVVKIPNKIRSLKDNAKINRYIKMHPKELFPKYDYSIYIDGNIKIISMISQLVMNVNKVTGLAIHRHSTNNCIFKEIKTCKIFGKGNYKKLKLQGKRYKKQGFPKNYGMLECNMIISDIKNEVSEEILNEWWNEYLNSESMRDQIALPYVLWKKNIKIEEIGNLGNNINKNYLLKINAHIR